MLINSGFLQGTVPAMNLGGKKKICSLEPLMLSVGAGKGSGATVSVEKGKSVLNSLVFRSQYKHITGRS